MGIFGSKSNLANAPIDDSFNADKKTLGAINSNDKTKTPVSIKKKKARVKAKLKKASKRKNRS